MVGGQLILLSPRWATRVIRVIDDLWGVMFGGVLLSGPAGPIQILGVYWPCPPPSTGEPATYGITQQTATVAPPYGHLTGPDGLLTGPNQG